MITRSLGPDPNIEVDIEGPHPLEPGDVFLLCSDGLSGPVEDPELGAASPANFHPKDACRYLLQPGQPPRRSRQHHRVDRPDRPLGRALGRTTRSGPGRRRATPSNNGKKGGWMKGHLDQVRGLLGASQEEGQPRPSPSASVPELRLPDRPRGWSTDWPSRSGRPSRSRSSRPGPSTGPSSPSPQAGGPRRLRARRGKLRSCLEGLWAESIE